MHQSRENTNRRITLQRLAGYVGLPVAMLLTSVGCFNAEAMLESRRVIAIRTRLEEVRSEEHTSELQSH